MSGILMQILSGKRQQIDGLLQERRNSIASALELPLSCFNPSKYSNCFGVYVSNGDRFLLTVVIY